MILIVCVCGGRGGAATSLSSSGTAEDSWARPAYSIGNELNEAELPDIAVKCATFVGYTVE